MKARKRSSAMKGRGAVLVRLRKHDSPQGVTRDTLEKLAKTMHLRVSEVVHVALVECAKANLPRYEPENGPLTSKQQKRIAELTRDTRATYRETDSLFGRESSADHNEQKDVRSVSRAG